MMDTILNLGLNDAAAEGLARATGNRRFALDSYRRLIQMYGEVVDGIDGAPLRVGAVRAEGGEGRRRRTPTSTTTTSRGLVDTFKAIYAEAARPCFPQDAREQLRRAVRAVFDSWETPRAQVYRRAHDIPDDLGTAVNVVQMVFGNKGDRSAHRRVLHARPVDRRAGPLRRVPRQRAGRGRRRRDPDARAARAHARRSCPRRIDAAPRDDGPARAPLPRHAGHRVHGRGRRALPPPDALRQADGRGGAEGGGVDERGGPDLAGGGGGADRPRRSSTSSCTRGSTRTPTTTSWRKGLNASPGAACGKVVLDADTAAEQGQHEPVILVRWETTPDDIHGLIEAEGVLTAHGGMTSHAAVVARGMGKPCVAGCEALQVDVDARLVAHRAGTRCARARRSRSTAARASVILGAVDARPAGHQRGLPDRPRLGRRAPSAPGACERGHARGRAQGARVRRARGSASAAPSTCSWPPNGSRSSAR